MNLNTITDLKRPKSADDIRHWHDGYAWLEAWRRLNRIWTIHFIVTGSAYPVMEELAQAYEKLIGGKGAEVHLQALIAELYTRFVRTLAKNLGRLRMPLRGSRPARASASDRPQPLRCRRCGGRLR